jgi:cold-inducible RNA-binding protein
MTETKERSSIMGTKLYVGNLPFSTSEQDLRALFETDGRHVTEITIVTDRMTGQPRGFGFVQMGSEEEAKAAIEALNGRELDGRSIQVNEARERTDRGGGGGGGGPGGRGRGGRSGGPGGGGGGPGGRGRGGRGGGGWR